MTKTYIFDNYEIEFPSSMQHEKFDDDYCYGIIFTIDGIKYEVIHNRNADWNRVLISDGKGLSRDIPFKPEAWHVLPAGVQVRNLDAK